MTNVENVLSITEDHHRIQVSARPSDGPNFQFQSNTMVIHAIDPLDDIIPSDNPHVENFLGAGQICVNEEEIQQPDA